MKQAVISCREIKKGTLGFFVSVKGQEHYLFSQSFRPAVMNQYRNDMVVDEALNNAKCRKHPGCMKVREKLLKTLPYIEEEYGLSLLRNKKNNRRSCPSVISRDEDEYDLAG